MSHEITSPKLLHETPVRAVRRVDVSETIVFVVGASLRKNRTLMEFMNVYGSNRMTLPECPKLDAVCLMLIWCSADIPIVCPCLRTGPFSNR